MLPKPLRKRFIPSQSRGEDLLILFVVAPRLSLDLRARRQVDNPSATRFRAVHEELPERQHRLGVPGRVGPDIGRDGTGVEGVGGDLRAGQTPRKLGAEQHVGQLRPRVRPHDPVAVSLELQVVEWQVAAAVHGARHVHHSSGRALFQEVQQERGEQERGEVVDCERPLDSVFSQLARQVDSARVVHKDVNPPTRRQDVVRQAADLLQ